MQAEGWLLPIFFQDACHELFCNVFVMLIIQVKQRCNLLGILRRLLGLGSLRSSIPFLLLFNLCDTLFRFSIERSRRSEDARFWYLNLITLFFVKLLSFSRFWVRFAFLIWMWTFLFIGWVIFYFYLLYSAFLNNLSKTCMCLLSTPTNLTSRSRPTFTAFRWLGWLFLLTSDFRNLDLLDFLERFVWYFATGSLMRICCKR